MSQPTMTRRNWFTSAGLLTSAGMAAAGAGPKGLPPTTEKYPRNLTKEDVDRWMTELSNWGKWGKEDQAGTINLITPAKRKTAAALVKEGVSVSASLDADLAKEGSTGVPLGGGGGPRGAAPGQAGQGASPAAGAPPAGANPQGGGRGPEGRGGQRLHWNALVHAAYRQRENRVIDLTDADLNVRAGLDANPVRLTRTE